MKESELSKKYEHLNLYENSKSRVPVPVGNYMFKVNNRNTRTRCEICSKLTIKTPERRQAQMLILYWCLSKVLYNVSIKDAFTWIVFRQNCQ